MEKVIKPITLIVVTLAVVGSVVEYLDPAYATVMPRKEIVSEAKLKQIEGLDETQINKSSDIKADRKPKSSRNRVTITFKLGSPEANKVYAKWFIYNNYSWDKKQYNCLEELWTNESGWRHTADNPNSSAYGIPQSLPGNKMASIGSDWKTNPATQIKWGAKYIKLRYGNPCGALKHYNNKNWY